MVWCYFSVSGIKYLFIFPITTGPIPESKGMHTIFQKREKYLKIWAKVYKI